jgi:hypothetical protein
MNEMPEKKDPGGPGAARMVLQVSDELTEEHAMTLLVAGKKKKGCPDLTITCKPTLVSCSPVAPQCAAYDIAPPGCSPLECSPVATQPAG